MFRTSKYEYLLKYILHEETDAEPSIYGVMGGLVHDTVEDLYKGKLKKENMLSKFDDFWTMNVEMLDIKFDRTNSEMNTKIKTKYYENLKLFMMNHELVEDKMKTEEFILIKVGKYYFQGYLDSCILDKLGNFIVNDWKTSTIYRGKTIEEKKVQLLLYSLGLHQMGVPISKLKACWNFLKYVGVDVQQKNGNVKHRNIERIKLGESLVASAKTWLKTEKYSVEEIENFTTDMVLKNSIDVLPKEVQCKFEIHDCYVYVDITEDSLREVEEYLESLVDDIVEVTNKYNISHDTGLFWDSDESLKQQEYYLFNLCDYTANKHKPFKQYLKNLELRKSENDFVISSGVNSESKDNVGNDDLSWLDNI